MLATSPARFLSRQWEDLHLALKDLDFSKRARGDGVRRFG
jgi:hypothetical protein